MNNLTLAKVKTPQTVKVKKVEGDAAVRLMEMGITPETKLDVIRSAPFEFPVEIKVRGNLLTLRESEASCIFLMQDKGVAAK